jgi:hypothetical protein
MTYHALLEYIRSAKDIGASDVEITERLKKAGWYSIDVADALDLYRRLTAHTNGSAYTPAIDPPKPSFFERLAPRHYEPKLVAIASLCFVAGFLLYTWLTAN